MPISKAQCLSQINETCYTLFNSSICMNLISQMTGNLKVKSIPELIAIVLHYTSIFSWVYQQSRNLIFYYGKIIDHDYYFLLLYIEILMTNNIIIFLITLLPGFTIIELFVNWPRILTIIIDSIPSLYFFIQFIIDSIFIIIILCELCGFPYNKEKREERKRIYIDEYVSSWFYIQNKYNANQNNLQNHYLDSK